MSSEQDHIELIQLHLRPNDFHNEGTIGVAAHLFSLFEDDYIKKIQNETFYVLPYKDISICVYESQLDDIPSNTLSGFATTVSDVLANSGMCNDPDHMVKCYEKFIEHISLAFAQKSFMQKVANNALEIANRASQLSLSSEQTVNRILSISGQAQDALRQAKSTAEKAEITAEHAKNLATEADAQAKSTIANYISILGIFASIIFTLFGGVNLIGSTVKLLEVNSRWPYLTFIIALLMICLLTLLNMMVKWINSMSNLKKALENQSEEGRLTNEEGCWYKPWKWDFYTKSVAFFLLILLISMCGMYHVNKENLFSITKETTTKNASKAEEDNKPVEKSKSENQNKEVTVVEKFTLSNHSNEKSSDKE
jgi:TRAP-type C4-dicarboxylate transport system permease small subunit